MTEDEPSLSVTTLRTLAEERLQTLDAGEVTSPSDDLLGSLKENQQSLHELRVHQIELEMQNEELRRAQVELDALRARYFDLYDLAPVGYCTLSEGGLIQEVNLTAMTLLDLARGLLVKQPFSRFILKEDQNIFYLHRKQLFDSISSGYGQASSPQTCELRMVRKDRSLFWALLESTVARGLDGSLASRVVLSDITERKQIEEARQHTQEMLEVANREYEQLLARQQHLARTDSLTGLYNRRHFFDLAWREFSAAVRYQRLLSILMFDVDDFKQVNDNHGHAAGDKILEQVALAAAAHVRSVDVLARYGGDEFIILLPQTSARQALPIAERIRASVAAMSIDTDKGQLGVSLSVGIAETSHEPADESVEAVIKRADKAMYAAKAAGRNQTRLYAEEPQG